MFKIDLSTGLGIAGAILALVLVVLDKAGKLKGPMLLVLLAVAAVLTLPLALSFGWIGNAQGTAKFSRGLLMFFVIGVLYSLIAVWVSPSERSSETIAGNMSQTPPSSLPITTAPSPSVLPSVMSTASKARRNAVSTTGELRPESVTPQPTPRASPEIVLEPGTNDRKIIREQLGQFLEEGRHLLVRCQNPNSVAPLDEANLWAGRVETYLRLNFDTSYIARFRSNAGLLPIGPSTQIDESHTQLWVGINNRLMRLEQFLQELKD